MNRHNLIFAVLSLLAIIHVGIMSSSINTPDEDLPNYVIEISKTKIICDINGNEVTFSEASRSLYNKETDETEIKGFRSSNANISLVFPGRSPGFYELTDTRQPKLYYATSRGDKFQALLVDEQEKYGDLEVLVTKFNRLNRNIEGSFSATVLDDNRQGRYMQCRFMTQAENEIALDNESSLKEV